MTGWIACTAYSTPYVLTNKKIDSRYRKGMSSCLSLLLLEKKKHMQMYREVFIYNIQTIAKQELLFFLFQVAISTSNGNSMEPQ